MSSARFDRFRAAIAVLGHSAALAGSAALLTASVTRAETGGAGSAWLLSCPELSAEQLEAFEARARAELLLRQLESGVELRCTGGVARLELHAEISGAAPKVVEVSLGAEALSGRDAVDALLEALGTLLPSVVTDAPAIDVTPPANEVPAASADLTPAPAAPTPAQVTTPLARPAARTATRRGTGADRAGHAAEKPWFPWSVSVGASVRGDGGAYLGSDVTLQRRLDAHWSIAVGASAAWSLARPRGFGFADYAFTLGPVWEQGWFGVELGPSLSVLISEGPAELTLDRSNVVPRWGASLRPYLHRRWDRWGLEAGAVVRWFHRRVEQYLDDEWVATRGVLEAGGTVAVTLDF